MIEYVEIRSKQNREIVGIIDSAQSVIWHRQYYGTGSFEIYVAASAKNLEMLVKGNFVTRPNDFDGTKYSDVGIIESIEITRNAQDGTMIVASGRFAKSILDRRHIYKLSSHTNKATILQGNVETAVRTVVSDNAISCAFDSARNIGFLALGSHSNTTPTIVDDSGNATQKQVSYDNLLDFTDELLEEYELSAKMLLDDSAATRNLLYKVYAGTDKSVDNTDSNSPVIFSAEFDNLAESEYSLDTQKEKNAILIGGAGEDLERFYSVIRGSKTGIDRKESWIDAKSSNRKQKKSSLQEAYPTGTFSGLTFSVDGTVIANLVTDTTQQYSLSSLQGKFPSGTVSGQKFLVSGVAYAVLIYGESDQYNLTDIGYKAMLDADDKEGDYNFTDAMYDKILVGKGLQKLSTLTEDESFSGKLIVTGGIWRLDTDYTLGDIVTIQDNEIGKYINARISEITETQDADGYTAEVKYTN